MSWPCEVVSCAGATVKAAATKSVASSSLRISFEIS
jgi:hypothetical protein